MEIFTLLFGRQSEREKRRDENKEVSFIYRFPTGMSTTSWAGGGLSQGQGTPSTQGELSVSAFWGAAAGSCFRDGIVGLELML